MTGSVWIVLNFSLNGLISCAMRNLCSVFKTLPGPFKGQWGQNKKGLEITAKISQDLTHKNNFSKKFSRDYSYSPDNSNQSTKGDGR